MLGVIILVGLAFRNSIGWKTAERERDEARQMLTGVCQVLEVIGDTSKVRLKREESNALIYPSLIRGRDGSWQVVIVWRNLTDRGALEHQIWRDGTVWQIDWAGEVPRQVYADSKLDWPRLFREETR
ncbi:MAG: hypothetical protein V1696_03155 [Candidatus Jorgensenbacteria bacterium]